MFVCPKCGYRDSPCWRASKYHPFACQTKLDELDTWEPQLAKKLRKIAAQSKDNTASYTEGAYYYRLTQTQRVYRMRKELKQMYHHGKYSEKHKPPLPTGQQQLTPHQTPHQE